MGKRLTPLEWTAIERQYREGAPAKMLARCYGAAESTIFRRASDERWRASRSSQRLSQLDRLERLTVRLENVLRLAEAKSK
ncbi:hypothetical protein [Caballeronia sp. LZ019]|uniref:hypothetical protein n=1 Tax=Caballeronia sp. LZ019 TaxID=3038555 RepID=UPI00285F27BD|nr:hypothetical protein [Caballeronia sp. LZ019]MDR5809530.1 hypothetical protein [Caballeronia sp. LZ019]